MVEEEGKGARNLAVQEKDGRCSRLPPLLTDSQSPIGWTDKAVGCVEDFRREMNKAEGSEQSGFLEDVI